MKTKMNLLDLPDEQFYNFCLTLDDITLSNLVKSNSKAYQICQEILDERLIKSLYGKWYTVMNKTIAEIRISDTDDSILIFSNWRLFPDMKESSGLFYKFIPKSDIDQIRTLKNKMDRFIFIRDV